MRCINQEHLYSLDEIAGMTSTLSSVTFAFLALTMVQFRLVFGILTAVTTFFFWIGYRVGKIKHAIDIRFAVILSFVMFLVLTLGFGIVSLALMMPSLLAMLSFEVGFLLEIFVLISGTAVMWKSRIPIIKAQDSLWIWLQNDFTKVAIQNDSELGNALEKAFRSMSKVSEYNALSAAFIIFIIFQINFIMVLLLALQMVGLFYFLRSESEHREVVDYLISLKGENQN